MTDYYSAKHWSEKARKQAVGTITENPDGSAKYWADRAEAAAGSVSIPTPTVADAGKFLMTTGTASQWQTVEALPTQTGNAGKYLITDGENASWAEVDLNSKANTNLDNITAAGKASVMNWCMPDYSNRVQREWNTEYVATENGVVTFNAFCDGSSHTVYVNINGQELFYTDDDKGIGPGWTGGSHQSYVGMFFIVGKGDTYKVYGGSGHQMMYFYPMKGEAE